MHHQTVQDWGTTQLHQERLAWVETAAGAQMGRLPSVAGANGQKTPTNRDRRTDRGRTKAPEHGGREVTHAATMHSTGSRPDSLNAVLTAHRTSGSMAAVAAARGVSRCMAPQHLRGSALMHAPPPAVMHDFGGSTVVLTGLEVGAAVVGYPARRVDGSEPEHPVIPGSATRRTRTA